MLGLLKNDEEIILIWGSQKTLWGKWVLNGLKMMKGI